MAVHRLPAESPYFSCSWWRAASNFFLNTFAFGPGLLSTLSQISFEKFKIAKCKFRITNRTKIILNIDFLIFSPKLKENYDHNYCICVFQ